MEFTVRIWFRFVSNGEQYAELEDYKIDALTIHDAFKKANEKYFKGYNAKPFKYGQVVNNDVDVWYNTAESKVHDKIFDKPIPDVTVHLLNKDNFNLN